MIGAWGGLVFGASTLGGVFTFDQFEKRFTQRIVNADIHLGMPVTEFCGYALMDVSFTMSFLAPWTVSPETGIAYLEAAMKSNIPYPLMIGYKPIGRGASLFICKELMEKLQYFNRNGEILGAKVDVKLQEYSIPSLSSGIIGQVAQWV